MRTALDTNILSGLLVGDARTPIIVSALTRCADEGSLLMSPIVFAELLARPGLDAPTLDLLLADTRIQVNFQMDPSVWLLAGNRFARHAARRRMAIRSSPRRILADFRIGAHALPYADRLMTLDTTVYAQDFPELELYPVALA